MRALQQQVLLPLCKIIIIIIREILIRVMTIVVRIIIIIIMIRVILIRVMTIIVRIIIIIIIIIRIGGYTRTWLVCAR